MSGVAQDPVDRDLDGHARRVLPRLPVPAGVALDGVGDRRPASSRTTAVPSRVSQRAPVDLADRDAACPSRTCRALADVPEVITRAVRGRRRRR